MERGDPLVMIGVLSLDHLPSGFPSPFVKMGRGLGSGAISSLQNKEPIQLDRLAGSAYGSRTRDLRLERAAKLSGGGDERQ
jgi:hypothetical protein